MNEYMLLIRNAGDGKAELSAEKHQLFLKACEVYISELIKKGQLVSAQPMVREGVMVSGAAGAFSYGPYNESSEILVGYYHILAVNLEEAVSIAQGNPEFAFVKNAKIEVRPLKTTELSTKYIYPSKKD